MQTAIHICKDDQTLASHARDWLTGRIEQHQAESDRPFVLVLAGGSTPRKLYRLLSKLPPAALDWSRILLVWGDERNVPSDHADSNFHMVRENLLQYVCIPSENVLAVPEPGGPADQAARNYASLLNERLPKDDGGRPILDCVLLGIGDDVHTASLFPDTDALSEEKRFVRENWVEKLDCWRITLTAPFINSAREIAFLISGEGKQRALDILWNGPTDTQKYPAQRIRPVSGRLLYMIDHAAAGNTALPDWAQVTHIPVNP